MKRSKPVVWIQGVAVAGLAGLLAGCKPPAPDHLQGYIEGEFIYVSSPLPGKLVDLKVKRGATVETGQELFALEDVSEQNSLEEAERRLAQARASLADLKKGARPSEVASIEARVEQARVALKLSEQEVARQEELLDVPGGTTRQEVDRAHAARDQDARRVSQVEAELATAKLGAREDQIAAAEENVRALEAGLAQAEWAVGQKRRSAPKSGEIFDTMYREGEWIAAGHPVVVVLPPANTKLRFFLPETRLGALQVGDSIKVAIDGTNDLASATVSFISPRAEYTPPVIYSRENRAKLVFLVEATFAPEVASRLHPGQPVDVKLAGMGTP